MADRWPRRRLLLLVIVVVTSVSAIVTSVVGGVATVLALRKGDAFATLEGEVTPWYVLLVSMGAALVVGMIGTVAVMAAERLRAWVLDSAPDVSGLRRPDEGGRG